MSFLLHQRTVLTVEVLCRHRGRSSLFTNSRVGQQESGTVDTLCSVWCIYHGVIHN